VGRVRVRFFARPLGLSLHFAADTVSMMLIALTVLLGPVCVLASWTAISERTKTYYGWLLVLQAAMTGVFCSRDVVLFYIFFEFTLVPMYILISLYGSTNRKAAATKFFLYTFTGSLITLAGLVWVAWKTVELSGGTKAWTFDFATLAATAQSLPPSQQGWLFFALLAGFAVKVPIFPFHTWLPLAHTEAPTAGSVVLAGVLLKLGTYGIFKIAIVFCPAAAYTYAPVLAVLAIIGIIYGGLICWVQTDIKKLVAYSSVSHLGFCVLGLFALNSAGLSGSVLYMINHGLSTGALFLMIGFMYERYHTRSLRELGGLGAKMPIWSTFMVFFVMSSVGLPGLNGFVGEFLCLMGAFQAGGWTWSAGTGVGATLQPGATWGLLGPWFAAVAGLGMIITAIYLLYMTGAIVFGRLKEPAGHASHGHGHGHGHAHGSGGHHHAHLPTDLSPREIGVLLPIAALCIYLGLQPTPMLKALEKPVGQITALVDAQRVKHNLDPAAPTPATPETPKTAGAEPAAATTPATEPGHSR
jgi:NADH-quinone oxidoreductase subunit M